MNFHFYSVALFLGPIQLQIMSCSGLYLSLKLVYRGNLVDFPLMGYTNRGKFREHASKPFAQQE